MEKKLYRIKLELYVELSESNKAYYTKHEGDLHEALVSSDNAKLTMEEVTIKEDWSEGSNN